MTHEIRPAGDKRWATDMSWTEHKKIAGQPSSQRKKRRARRRQRKASWADFSKGGERNEGGSQQR